MGLDVYLYEYDVPLAEFEKQAEAAERLSTELGLVARQQSGIPVKGKEIDWDAASKEQTSAYFAAVRRLNQENGLDEDGDPKSRHKIEEASALHPEHYFKIGYFRSSYNGGGINRVLRNMELPCLDDLFPGDDYVRSVDWAASRERAVALREGYAKAKADLGDLTVLCVAHNAFIPRDKLPTDEAAATALFKAERASKQKAPASLADYGNAVGEFFWSHPFKATAMIPGVGPLGSPCLYLVGEYERTESKGTSTRRQSTS